MEKAYVNPCASVDIYKSLEFCKGETVLPGIRPEVWFIKKSQILGWPPLDKPSDEGATMESIATYKGDFMLPADVVFRQLDVLTTASNVTSASQGDPPSKTFLNSSTLKHAGNSAAATGFCRMANSDDLVFVFRQRDGKFRVIGNESFETNVNPSQDSGMAVTDASGTQLEVSVTDVCPAPFYVGKLPTEKGVIDCSTGKIAADDGEDAGEQE